MRDMIVIGATIIMFAGLFYGGVLQDRMRQSHIPGESLLSAGSILRSFRTREAGRFVILVLALAAFGAAIIAMDAAGYLPR